MFALIDGNNFYCSCERIFQPRLQKAPLVVLSNNDGCAIARSEDYVELKFYTEDMHFSLGTCNEANRFHRRMVVTSVKSRS